MQRGFSILELVLVIAILALLTSGLVGVYVGLRNSISVDTGAEMVRSALTQQRTRAQGGAERRAYGVRMVSDATDPYFEFFSYDSSSGTTTGQRVDLPETITFADPIIGNESIVRFESITGYATHETSIILMSPSDTATVSVSATGLVQ